MKVTIEHKEKQSEDIFTPGSLVFAKDTKLLVLVSEKVVNAQTFSGAVMKTTDYHEIGEFGTSWAKCCFTKFVGTILLEQD